MTVNLLRPALTRGKGATASTKIRPVVPTGSGEATKTRVGGPTSTVNSIESSAGRPSPPSISTRP